MESENVLELLKSKILFLAEQNINIENRMKQNENALEFLKSKNSSLEEQNIKLEREIAEYRNILKDLINDQDNMFKVIDYYYNKLIQTLANSFDNLAFEFNYDVPDGYVYPKIESEEETVRKIIEEGVSLSRFGDGEFSIIANNAHTDFQKYDTELSRKLLEVLKSDNAKLSIGIANNYGNLTCYSAVAAHGIRDYMTCEVRDFHAKLLNPYRVYSNAYLTRFYLMYKDRFTDAPRKRLNNLKRIWDKRNVIIVEGAETRLGVLNNLFDNAGQIRRILAPATNSFSRYSEVFKAAQEFAEKDTLFLLAIGPSSTILAYDLTVLGHQAVDVGHIDIEYEWMLAGKGIRVSVPHKFNNEFSGGDIVEPINDPTYLSQIVASFL